MSEQAELLDVKRIAGKQPFVHGAHNLNGKIEWYTPPKYIAAAKQVMGSIDLDPCTSELAQRVVQAGSYLTIDDDGLIHPWNGNVWMNPPYASKIITAFVDKLLASIASKNVTQAIMLTHNNADTAWFHKSAMNAASVCFTRGRVRFYDENGEGNSPTHGHVFMYFGRRRKTFERVFSEFGWICRGVN